MDNLKSRPKVPLAEHFRLCHSARSMTQAWSGCFLDGVQPLRGKFLATCWPEAIISKNQGNSLMLYNPNHPPILLQWARRKFQRTKPQRQHRAPSGQLNHARPPFTAAITNVLASIAQAKAQPYGTT